MEIWKLIKGIEDYEISNYGNIRNLKTGRIIKKSINRDGYLYVTLRKNKKQITKLVHRIVCLSFIYNEFEKETVNHIDGIKTNNFVSNLEWNTRKEQAIHRDCNMLRIPHNRKKVINIFTKEIYNSVKDLCQKENIIYPTIVSKLNGGRTNDTPYKYA